MMSNTMHEDRMHAGIAQQHLEHGACGRIPLDNGVDVVLK
jgi:hypothetical protein